MNKKTYQRPAVQVVALQHQCQLLAGSLFDLSSVDSNADLLLGEADDGIARANEFVAEDEWGDWGDWHFE